MSSCAAFLSFKKKRWFHKDRKSKFHFSSLRPEIVILTRMFSTSIVKCLSILITSLSNVIWHDKDAPAVKLALFFFLAAFRWADSFD